MKKVLLALALVCGVAATQVSANDYVVDNNAIEMAIDNATEVSMDNMYGLDAMQGTQAQFNQKSGWTAWVLCWVVGGFGVHRHYLGTKGSMWATYTFTCCGIFGVVTTIDWFVLLIDGAIKGNISKYENNEKFFMWTK